MQKDAGAICEINKKHEKTTKKTTTTVLACKLSS